MWTKFGTRHRHIMTLNFFLIPWKFAQWLSHFLTGVHDTAPFPASQGASFPRKYPQKSPSVLIPEGRMPSNPGGGELADYKVHLITSSALCGWKYGRLYCAPIDLSYFETKESPCKFYLQNNALHNFQCYQFINDSSHTRKVAVVKRGFMDTKKQSNYVWEVSWIQKTI
jgi:hypothetical protein